MNFIYKLNISLLLLSVFVIRLVVYGSSVGDSIALLGLAGLYGYIKYLKTIEFKPLEQEVKKDITDLKSALSVLKINNSIKTKNLDEQKQTRFF